jgi:hypothetical protein
MRQRADVREDGGEYPNVCACRCLQTFAHRKQPLQGGLSGVGERERERGREREREREGGIR